VCIPLIDLNRDTSIRRTKSSFQREEEERELKQIKRILVPIDGSKFSFKAADYAVGIAKRQRSQVYCIHAIARVPYGHFLNGYAAQMYIEDAKKQAESWFNDISIKARQKDLSNNNGTSIDILAKVFVTVNPVVETIVNYSVDKNIDLIVIGTRGRSGIKRLLLGSIAKGVVQCADCPVLLVR
jgi:nucleotide-binding universal stress UspA family protein